MRKAIVLFLFMLSFSPAAVAADKPLGVEEYTSVEELALTLSSYFPKVQGEVKAVQGDRLTLSLQKKDGLMPGMVLTLWRDGKQILHPVTNAVIGHAEDEVGTIEVTSVSDTSSTAVVKKKLKEPRQGDRARITPRKVNLAIIPLREEHPEIIRSLAERLNEFGRFNVLDTGKVDAFLRNTKTKDAAVVRELGTAFGLDAVISMGIYPSEGRLMITARIFYTDDASQLDTVVAMLDLKSKKEALGELKPFFTPITEEKTITPELPFVAQYFAAGDFDGDGKLEYAFSDVIRIHIYRNEPSGWREVWTEIVSNKDTGTSLEWQGQTAAAEPGTSVRHINIDSGDINGNSRPEIFVTEMLNGKVISYVVEFQDGSYRRIAEAPGFLRVITYPGRGKILIGQEYDPLAFYSGQPKQYVWSQGKYLPDADVQLPKGLGIYGWTFANLGERHPLLVALDDDDHVLVYSGETLVWKSAEQYATVDNYVYKPVTGIGGVLSKQTTQTDKSQRVRLPGRVLAVDMNGDGRHQIMVVKNIRGAFIGGFSSAELDRLIWTGARMDPAGSIKEIPGAIFDFRSIPEDRSGIRINALVRTKGGVFTKDRQQVMSYTLTPAGPDPAGTSRN